MNGTKWLFLLGVTNFNWPGSSKGLAKRKLARLTLKKLPKGAGFQNQKKGGKDFRKGAWLIKAEVWTFRGRKLGLWIWWFGQITWFPGLTGIFSQGRNNLGRLFGGIWRKGAHRGPNFSKGLEIGWRVPNYQNLAQG